MNLGRRKFLAFATTAVVGTKLSPLSPTIITDKYFVDNRLGFGFAVPAGWTVESFSPAFENMNTRQILSDEFEETKELWHQRDEILHILQDGLSASVFKNPGKHFSPGITFYIDNDILENDSLLQIAEECLHGYSKIFKEFSCLEAPKTIAGSNFEATSCKFKYLFEHVELNEPTMINSESMVLRYNELDVEVSLPRESGGLTTKGLCRSTLSVPAMTTQAL